MGKIQISKDDPGYAEMMAMDAERKKHMSSAEDLKLPRLLEERRQEHGIPDGVFAAQPLAERVFIYQVKDAFLEGGKIGGIHVPQTVLDKERFSAPRGILVAAGLMALDVLKTNGIELGHIVWFAKNYAWKRGAGYIAGEWDYVLPMNVGDIFGSEDLEMQRRSREVRVVWDEEKSEHQFVDSAGKPYKPMSPWIGADS